MRILITSDLFDSTINGVVTSIRNLEKELTGQGHEVRILTVSDKTVSYRRNNVYYVGSVPSGIYPDIRIPVSRGRDYVKELIAWKPDVVHSQCEFFSYGFAKKIAKASGAVLIHTCHTLYEQYTEYLPIGRTLGKTVLGKWMKTRLCDADIVIAPTKKVEHTIFEYGMQNKVEVIPSGIQLNQFLKAENVEKTQMLKKRYQIAEEKKVLLSLGRLGFEKRIDELLEGMKLLAEQRQDILLLIVGGGPARESLEKKVKELQIEEFVRFTGMVQPTEIADYYKLGDVFVCASTSETQGLTYIEAMASGLPLVCRRDACLLGVLESGRNGYVYELVKGFAEGVKHLLGNAELYEHAVQHSRSTALKYGTEQFGNCVIHCYEQTCVEKEQEKNESVTVCKKQEGSFKKWCRACYAYAGRIS